MNIALKALTVATVLVPIILCTTVQTQAQILQRRLTIQDMQTISAIAFRRAECVTVIVDPNPPTNVRSTPVVNPSNIVGRLNQFTVINVISNKNGWLKISSPVKGWVSLNLTLVDCGSTDYGLEPVFKSIEKVFKLALDGDRNAIDMLVRFSLSTDGVIADVLSSDCLPQIAEKRADLLISVLNSQPENYRRQFLYILAITSSDNQISLPQRFGEVLARQSASPTAISWRLVKSSRSAKNT